MQQRRRHKLALLWGVVGIVMVFFFVGVGFPRLPFPSNLAVSESLGPQQEAFVEIMLPQIVQVNQQILTLRERIESIAAEQKKGEALSDLDKRLLVQTAMEYQVSHFQLNDPASMTELLKRVDIVPNSLVLSQAANESGWGQSRFAQMANNFFGQYCYASGCGVAPNSNNTYFKGYFELQKFHNAGQAISNYLYNLNTNPAYAQFREKRAQLRAAGQPLTGVALAPYLVNYSVLGEGYVNIINSIMLAHDFAQYDNSNSLQP